MERGNVSVNAVEEAAKRVAYLGKQQAKII